MEDRQDRIMAVFYEIHQDIPREAPGNAASTQRAFASLAHLPSQPTILDIGCGPGAQTLTLAELTPGKIIAVDNHPPFLTTLAERVGQLGLGDRIHIQLGDMTALEFPAASFDLIWAEGAIYIMGFAAGLQMWRSLLKPHGYIAVSEATWLQPNPPTEIKAFWQENYPAMQDVQGNLDIIRTCGYQVVDHFTLPESAWWDDYYHPLEQRLETLRQTYVGDGDALEAIALTQAEINLYRQYSTYYGYVFYIMQREETITTVE